MDIERRPATSEPAVWPRPPLDSRCPGRDPADPRALAQEIVREARSRGGLLLFADFERTLSRRMPDRSDVGVPLLVRGALVALASAPATGVVVMSGRDACDLEGLLNVPGLIYAGCRGL